MSNSKNGGREGKNVSGGNILSLVRVEIKRYAKLTERGNLGWYTPRYKWRFLTWFDRRVKVTKFVGLCLLFV